MSEELKEKLDCGLAVKIGDEIITPLGARIIVKQKVRSNKIKGADGKFIELALPEEAIKGGSLELFDGAVLAVGPSITKVKKGDIVSFGMNSFSTKKFSDGEEYLILFENAICYKSAKEEN